MPPAFSALVMDVSHQNGRSHDISRARVRDDNTQTRNARAGDDNMETSASGTRKHTVEMFRAQSSCELSMHVASGDSEKEGAPDPQKGKTKGIRNLGRQIKRIPKRFRRKIGSRSKSKKDMVEEISIKPERQQCWYDGKEEERVSRRSLSASQSPVSDASTTAGPSRNGRAGSTQPYSDHLTFEDVTEHDGIPVVHDADYNGGV